MDDVTLDDAIVGEHVVLVNQLRSLLADWNRMEGLPDVPVEWQLGLGYAKRELEKLLRPSELGHGARCVGPNGEALCSEHGQATDSERGRK